MPPATGPSDAVNSGKPTRIVPLWILSLVLVHRLVAVAA